MSTRVRQKVARPPTGSPLWAERRAKPRVMVPFRAAVRGVDDVGTPFEVATVVDNLSANGLYLRLTKGVSEGARLLINVSLYFNPAGSGDDGLSLEVYGFVRRVDRLPGGAAGVAVSFTTGVLL